MKRSHRLAFPLTLALVLSSCDGGGAVQASGTPGSNLSTSSSSSAGPTSPATPPPPSTRTWSTDVLLFAGTGTWASEVSAIEGILQSNGATYQALSSAQLDSMSANDLAKFGMMIFPGGAGGTEASSLSANTHAQLRTAVQQNGVGYIGFCAGAFIGEAPAPAAAQDVSYGLGVVAGPLLDYYYLENQGTDIAMTEMSFADGSTKDILWYGGPVTPNIASGVIAKYPDGTPAISEMWSGNGFVILSGGHPTATQAMLSTVGMSSTDGIHQDLAWSLMQAVLHQKPIKAF